VIRWLRRKVSLVDGAVSRDEAVAAPEGALR
jgi:hypothetical protein